MKPSPRKKPMSYIRTQEQRQLHKFSYCETLKNHRTTLTVAVCTEPHT